MLRTVALPAACADRAPMSPIPARRLNTTGGVAPSEPGGCAGEESRVACTPDYYFHRAP